MNASTIRKRLSRRGAKAGHFATRLSVVVTSMGPPIYGPPRRRTMGTRIDRGLVFAFSGQGVKTRPAIGARTHEGPGSLRGPRDFNSARCGLLAGGRAFRGRRRLGRRVHEDRAGHRGVGEVDVRDRGAPPTTVHSRTTERVTHRHADVYGTRGGRDGARRVVAVLDGVVEVRFLGGH